MPQDVSEKHEDQVLLRGNMRRRRPRPESPGVAGSTLRGRDSVLGAPWVRSSALATTLLLEVSLLVPPSGHAASGIQGGREGMDEGVLQASGCNRVREIFVQGHLALEVVFLKIIRADVSPCVRP